MFRRNRARRNLLFEQDTYAPYVLDSQNAEQPLRNPDPGFSAYYDSTFFKRGSRH